MWKDAYFVFCLHTHKVFASVDTSIELAQAPQNDDDRNSQTGHNSRDGGQPSNDGHH